MAEYATWGDTTLKADGLGAYIAEVTKSGNTALIIVNIGVMSLFVVAMNKLVWRRLYGFAERRFRLDCYLTNSRPSMTNLISAKTSAPPIAELRVVFKSFNTAGGHELKVLEQIDIAVHEGELLALLGQSGSGKSTILRCLTGLIEPTSGRVLHKGETLHGINEDASVVFQTFALYPWLTVAQNVAVGLMAHRVSRAERDAAVDRAIELIGLGNYHAAYPRELSGGMRQCVGIARALVSQPRLLCLDEAFSALDVLTAENLRQELISLWRTPETGLSSIFMVTHSIAEAVELATRIVVLFPRPGRLGLVLENKLPYPRDSKSAEFQRLVSLIHECITTTTCQSK